MRSFFFFNYTATTEIYTLSLHDALPISHDVAALGAFLAISVFIVAMGHRIVRTRTEAARAGATERQRSEEHTSELQSRQYLVCRLLLEKKKTTSFSLLPLIVLSFSSILH